MRGRLLLGAAGVAMGAFGLLRLLQRDLSDLVDVVVWLTAGVILHDLVLAPLTVALTVLLRRVVPRSLRTRATVGLVVLATVTATAVPVLGRWGAREDNPTLLDRNYVGGWLVLAAVVVVCVLLAGPARRLLARLGSSGATGSHGS